MKAKSFIISAILIFSMASCRKDRQCTCTITTESLDTSTNTIGYSTASDKRKVKKVTKRQALAGDCASTESNYQVDTFSSTTKTECKLD